ncbi:peptidoglycan amidohydrolase family protein [Enterococcus quebecensis]|uniref:Bacteriophage lysin domain-containing protein n=2 Tax=Enterococcus quebecensis TaxID=903983 RepID=A0A1E5GUH5_9ENTE|nr:peptidoglycan amidohydrolase family protein [Enterococcus quebecensis]OEG16325.1 hypothetical protein BCR23_05400 [Enterococcus quebecensis]
MGNIETMIKWMKDREGKVTYSMINRLGPNSYDCSSAVYFSLRASGFLPDGSMGNTDTLFGDLERNNWKQIEMTNGVFEVQRGDVFIWGTRGASGGEYGHTGIFVDSKANIIHCNFGYNGITTNPHNNIWNANSQPPITVYRPAISTPKPTPSTKFKVGEIVTFTNIATNWVGGAKIGFFSMMRNFRVNRLNDDGTIYIRMMDDSWGSNVYERDIQRAPNNSIERNDVVKLRPQATHWVNGNAINIDNKTTRTFHVKARKENQLLLYADSAGGWEVWTYDWDCILVSKFKVSKTPSYGNPNNIQANEKVTFGQNATKWKNYKGISSNVTIKLNEYNSVYNVLQRNADNTIRIQSQEDGTIHGWIKVSEAEKAPNNQFKRGDYVKLKASATHWVNGDAINIDNKTTRSFLVKTRIGNTLLVYSEAANGWQTWVYDWDVTK